MARYRSYLFPEAIIGERYLVLDVRESYHLVRVFRAKVGEEIEVLDGRGTRYIGAIERASNKGVRVAVESVEIEPVLVPRITLLQSVPKGKAMDIILRMATEIGVSVIQPIFTDQGEHAQPKLEKWRLSTIEACKQCGLSYVPILLEPCRLRDWLQKTPSTEGTLRLVASLEEGSRPLIETLNVTGDFHEVVAAVGPAGDFSTAEYELLRESDFKSVRLGANILRTETAAAYILGVVDQIIRN